MSAIVLSEQRPRERSPIDVLRLVAGGMLLGLGLFVANTFDNAFVGLRDDGQSILDSLPDWAADVPAALLSVGLLAGVVAALGWALLTRRYRRLAQLVAALAVAAGASLALGQLVEAMVDQEVRDAFIVDGRIVEDPLLRVITSDGGVDRVALGDPLLAGSVAALAVTGTWMLRRRSRQLAALLAVTAMLTTLTAGVPALTLLVDVAVGLVAAAIVFLVSKRHDPSLLRSELVSAAAAIGIDLEELRPMQVDARGSRPWVGTTVDGRRVFCKTLSRDERSADLLFRFYRWLRIRRSGDERPFISLRRAVEHEALVAFQAGSIGVATPTVLGVNRAGLDGIVLLFEAVDGRSLDGDDNIDDSTLVDVWQMVDLLHRHRIAHRDLRLANVLLGVDGVARIIDFGFAEVGASDQLLATDVAELLASTAAVVGPQRAVAAAHAVLDVDALESALPWLQPLALSGATRVAIGGEKGLRPLRSVLMDDCGLAAEPPVRLERVSGKTILVIATLALSAVFLLPQLADLDTLAEQVRDADPRWMAVAVAFSTVTYLGATVSLIGAIPCPVEFRGAYLAQLASSFANRVTPAKIGGVATNVRYFQKQGVPVPVAVSAVGINGLAGFVVHVTLTTFFLILASRSDVDTPLSLPSTALLMAIPVGILAVSALVYAVPWGRRLLATHVMPYVRTAYDSMKSVAARPSKLAALFGGSALITLAYLVAFIASLKAFGSDVSLPVVAVLFLSGSAVAQAAPTPGGLGATEAALVAALSTVEAPEIVVPAVFLYRLVTYWLPILPGWLAMTSLQHRGQL